MEEEGGVWMDDEEPFEAGVGASSLSRCVRNLDTLVRGVVEFFE